MWPLLFALYGLIVFSWAAEFCSWSSFRAAVIRDQVWIDGGYLYTPSSQVDGPLTKAEGLFYYLNFSVPFDTTTTNLTSLFYPVAKTGSAGNSDIAPDYVNGAMFANEQEFYLYGGLTEQSDATSQPDYGQTIYGYEIYNNGQLGPSGLFADQLSGTLTQYVTNGACANVPSENLGFYFSGMQAPDGSPIWYAEYPPSATLPASSLIQVDMKDESKGAWQNLTFSGSGVSPRADAQMVWIPVSTQGLLAVIGGVINPEEVYDGAPTQAQITQSDETSPGFMHQIPIYDIHTQTWYLQNTTSAEPDNSFPPQLSSFCSVVATANDSSSYNIYIYGGYDGTNSEDPPSDDVWVLSLPSFIWVKVYAGSPSHGRSSHFCAQPYPNLMFVIGGIRQDQTHCVGGGIVQVFNLNDLQFQDIYSPLIGWEDYIYHVPSPVSSAIAGKSATFTDPGLQSLFSTPYPGTIPTYYPYTPVPTPASSSSTPVGAIAGGVVGGVLVLAIIAGAVLYFRKHGKKQREGEYGLPDDGLGGTRDKTGSVSSATEVGEENKPGSPLHGYYEVAGSSSPRQDPQSLNSPGTMSSTHSQSQRSIRQSQTAEVEGAPLHELQGGLQPVEMATPWHYQQHSDYPRSIDYALVGRTSSPSNHPSEVMSSHAIPHNPNEHHLKRASQSTGFPTSPASPGSLGNSPTVSSPANSPSVDAEGQSPSFGSHGESPEVGTPDHHPASRPPHHRHVSSMDDLPESVSGSRRREHNPRRNVVSFVSDMTASPPQPQQDFGPDGTARSASVVNRRPVPGGEE